jgi:hypothetical protein
MRPVPTRTKTDLSDEEDDRTLRSNSSFITLSGALGRLSRRSTGDSGKCVDGNWNLDAYPEPKGFPTREHWKVCFPSPTKQGTFLCCGSQLLTFASHKKKPDHESAVCDHSTCRRTFSYFTRRHHCRCCGNIFCDTHSAYEVPLDERANYNPRGVPVRACAHCYGQFKEWRSRTNSHDSSLLSAGGNQRGTMDGTAGAAGTTTPGGSPLSTSPIRCKGKPTPPSVAEVAVSVPRDWNWSTF